MVRRRVVHCIVGAWVARSTLEDAAAAGPDGHLLLDEVLHSPLYIAK